MSDPDSVQQCLGCLAEQTQLLEVLQKPGTSPGEAEGEGGPFKRRRFYSGVNGNQRANIPLRNECGEDPVPTIIISVTNREHRELFHDIMKHYIVLEKTVFEDM